MDYRCMLVGSYLKAVELGQGDMPVQPTFKIVNVTLEKLESISLKDTEDQAGKLETKGLVYFEGLDRAWVLNRTNAECLAAIFGSETNNWIGKRVTLHAAPVRVGTKMDIGIRVLGSPDIDQEIAVSVKLPRRKPVVMTLKPTGTRPALSEKTLIQHEADGRTAAGFGTDALAAWWKALSKDAQTHMKRLKDYTLKPLAARADEEAKKHEPAASSAPEPPVDSSDPWVQEFDGVKEK